DLGVRPALTRCACAGQTEPSRNSKTWLPTKFIRLWKARGSRRQIASWRCHNRGNCQSSRAQNDRFSTGWSLLIQKLNLNASCRMRGVCAAPICKKEFVVVQLESPAELFAPA